MPDDNVEPSGHESGEDDSDLVHTEPATSGHSDADSQAQRNIEDESPS